MKDSRGTGRFDLHLLTSSLMFFVLRFEFFKNGMRTPRDMHDFLLNLEWFGTVFGITNIRVNPRSAE